MAENLNVQSSRNSKVTFAAATVTEHSCVRAIVCIILYSEFVCIDDMCVCLYACS